MYRSDALSVEHDFAPEKFCQKNNSEIIIQTSPACHVLQKTSPSADNEVGGENFFHDGENIFRRYRVHVMSFLRVLRIQRNDGDVDVAAELPETFKHCRKHRLVPAVS